MDTAFKKVFAGRQACDLELAALKHSSPGYRDLAKAAGTFGNGMLSWAIELRYEAATEVLHLGEGVRFAALIDNVKSGSFLDVDGVRFEVPVWIRMSSLRFRKQVRQRREISQRDILAESRPERLIEGCRIAFVQGHNLFFA